MDAAVLSSTLLSPAVLFFMLGMIAALARTRLTLREPLGKVLALYLMMAIGLKGGAAMAVSGFGPEVLRLLAAAVLLSAAIPLLAFAALRLTTDLSPLDAAATAGHYGSISIVTFVAASQTLQVAGIASDGHLVAAAALMEAPAIVVALVLASKASGGAVAGSTRSELQREVLLNGSVTVLVGALFIGWATGPAGMASVAPFFIEPFQGVLCVFLLDMGLVAGKGLRDGWRELGFRAVGFGLYMPLVSAGVAAMVSRLLGLNVGNAALLMSLAASASYIAVPAAMRLALPQARPSIYLTLSLGVTFPFNILIGIALYMRVAQVVAV